MSKSREPFIQAVVKGLSEIDPGNASIPIIADSIRKMNNTQFEQYISALRNGVSETPDLDAPREIIPIVVPNMEKTKITIERNFALGKKWGCEFFSRVWMTDPKTNTTYLTNIPYAVLELPIQRQAQTLEKGISTTGDNLKVDSRTNQVASGNHNKGASFSGPELQTILSKGNVDTAIELMKFKGGDLEAYNAMIKSIIETGEFSMSSYTAPTRAKATVIAGVYFKSRHINTDI